MFLDIYIKQNKTVNLLYLMFLDCDDEDQK